MSLSIEELYKSAHLPARNENIKINEDYSGYDVFIAGSGPIGATYAKKCVDAGLSVLMVEIGAADSFKPTVAKHDDNTISEVFVPGYHKKNEIEYQKDIDRFVHVIQGALGMVSIPVQNVHVDMLDPVSWANRPGIYTTTQGRNPKQSEFNNLSAQAVTRGVGGMTTHWTCATPRFNLEIELPRLHPTNTLPDNEALWKPLYEEAEKLIGTSSKEFDRSIRHTLVLKTLQERYGAPREFKPLPLACHRMPNPDYIEWHATDRILEELYTDDKKRKLFKLLTNHLCTRLIIEKEESGEYTIGLAELRDLLKERSEDDDIGPPLPVEHSYMKAKVYVIAAGAVSTPQILFNSGFCHPQRNLIPNLGKYITEQTYGIPLNYSALRLTNWFSRMTFCQVVLKEELIDKIPNDPYNLPWWKVAVGRHREKHPKDPLPIPHRDPEPQVTSPFHPKDHPWHTQIHRDAFLYGAVAKTIDPHLVVDLRFFGYVEPRAENRIEFETEYEDAYGMPQPTFHFKLGDSDRKRAHDMMLDMCKVADLIGGFLPDSNPQFMAPGLALHLGGTVRAGWDKEKTVADTYCKVHNFKNLFVGGNGVIETGFAANPTLTSMGFAIRSSEAIIEMLKKPKGQ